jgi:TPR repeat protein
MNRARRCAQFALAASLALSGAACGAAGASPAPLARSVASMEVAPAPRVRASDDSKASALPPSAQAFQRACDLGSARGCNDLGVKFLDGEGVAKDAPRAVSLLQRGCDLKLPMACFNLGYMLASGLGTPRDPSGAMRLYDIACEQKVGLACNALGNLVNEAEAPDAKRALTYFEKACDLKTMGGCVNAASLYDEGKDVPSDRPKAARYYRLGCDADVGIGCSGLAIMLLRGEGGLIADPPAAAVLYEKGCRLDAFYGCYTYGVALTNGELAKADPERARTALQSSCDAGNADACAALGTLIDSDK